MAQKPNKYQFKYSIINKDNKQQNVIFNSYMFGIVSALKIKKEHSLHALVLIIGSVGSGKSSFAKGMAGLDANRNGLKLNIDDFNWKMESVINAMDNPDNVNRPIIADEWIQSGGSRGFALTKIGNKLKIGFVTKRLKKNTYYLLVDKIQEFPETLIEMADCLVNVKRFGIKRGYFDIYTKQNDIYFIWNGIKHLKQNWNSKDIKNIKPAHTGMFPDYENIFVDEDEYNKRKMEETKQNEEDTFDKKDITIDNCIIYLFDLGLKGNKIASITGLDPATISRKKKKLQIAD